MAEGGESLNKELAEIKEALRRALAMNDRSPDTDLNELAVIIPKEVERVEEQQAKLETELKALHSLLQIVGSDMLAGVESNEVGARVWNMMTSFKVNIDTEKAQVKCDINRI